MSRDNWEGADPKYIGKVYVGGIGADITRSELEAEYGKFGAIRDVWIAHNPAGFAFVEFHQERDATAAIRATDGARVCGYKVSVEASHGRKSKRKRYLEDVRCYNCNRWGHLAKVCTRAYGDYRRSPSRRDRRRSRSRSPRRRHRTRSRSRSPRHSRSRSPRRTKSKSLRRSKSRSPRRSKSRSPRRSKSRSSRRSRSRSRKRGKRRSDSKSISRSRERRSKSANSRSRSKERSKSRDSRERDEKSPSKERKRSRSEDGDEIKEDFIKDEVEED